ncbi:MAG: HAD hydrolase-like protein, partial [bacterium]|nr:HAD hydrolase-like protein [bacterium]
MKLQHILFDLDGTLTDPKIGITRSIQYALEKLKKPVPACDNLTWCIGPPLLDSLHRLVGGEDLSLAREALALYRERFSELGKFENTVYPDIPELLKNLQQQGFQLFLATAKPDLFARDILDHFQLSSYFSNIYGSKLNGELSKKGDLIQHIIQRERLQAEHALMVGDR